MEGIIAFVGVMILVGCAWWSGYLCGRNSGKGDDDRGVL